ncbi:hypothetical protein E2562_022202 [Oryza meyeriana var. granulata]|uniref:Uncharacterized protein n=1 Tax=Oryza meyeriana var. granulata TaxID=110450 RepID=A0A6G1DKQ9_9ORYZ|nr:hypothetical protein E2562_022202 [Oryza meyeriana var. granulata]
MAKYGYSNPLSKWSDPLKNKFFFRSLSRAKQPTPNSQPISQLQLFAGSRAATRRRYSRTGAASSLAAAAASSQLSPLGEWNSYAAACSAEDGGFGIDIEAAVRSANDHVAGTFGVYSH